MTERTLRNRMKNEGYRLRKGRDVAGMIGFQIIDFNNIIVAGEHFELDFYDVIDFLNKSVF